MAASIDESEELFHLLNGTDDQIKTYADLKPGVLMPKNVISYLSAKNHQGSIN